MKKKRVVTLLFVSILCMYLHSYSVYAFSNKSLQNSKEEHYKDIISSLLMQYIDKSVGDYYANFLTQKPLVDSWDIEILSVERPNNFFIFLIKLQVRPYVGPHLGVGVDRITLTVDGIGNVTVNNFKHIESNYLDLPPNYQHIIKKNLKVN